MPTRARLFAGLLAMLLGAFGLLLALIPGSPPAFGDNDPKTVELKASQRNTTQTDPSYEDTDCGGLDPANGAVWHFVANNLNGPTDPVSFTAKFGPSANTVTETLGDVVAARRNNNPKTAWQFFVQSTQPVLVDAIATFDKDQAQDADMVLSHICGGSATTTTTTSIQDTTTSQESTTTTEQETTTTTEESTTTTTEQETTTTTTTTTTIQGSSTTASTTTTTLQGTSTTQGTTTTTVQVGGSSTVPDPTTTTLPTEVQGAVIERLPRTGTDYGYLLLVSSALLLIGGTLLYHSELRRRGLI